jgi:hypothetical protein
MDLAVSSSQCSHGNIPSPTSMWTNPDQRTKIERYGLEIGERFRVRTAGLESDSPDRSQSRLRKDGLPWADLVLEGQEV